MPYLKITTNATVLDQTNLLKASSQTVAKATGKSENYVMIVIEDKTNMSMAGNNSPAAFLDYRALGLPSDRSAFSDALCSLITNELGISGDRIYISMTDSERQNWGWNHTTF
ncbi:phenylpyruvate tautomerase MIF-related protein [Pseudomonadota bacterium]|nr:phenylpyruvate tautomerase MIF-related protein [Pseudomonadota bacterium]